MGIKTLDERVMDLECGFERLEKMTEAKMCEMISLVREGTKRTPAQLANDIKLRKNK